MFKLLNKWDINRVIKGCEKPTVELYNLLKDRSQWVIEEDIDWDGFLEAGIIRVIHKKTKICLSMRKGYFDSYCKFNEPYKMNSRELELITTELKNLLDNYYDDKYEQSQIEDTLREQTKRAKIYKQITGEDL